MDHLGQAKKITVSKENTTIVDGAGRADEIQARVEQIRTQIAESSSTTTKKNCKNVLLN
ncbi:hypothetical protein [Shewanella glacialipiscicola]|uniref:hypothetical protein n=1 Tax=Shewanella glacialipiscicola TaxID=614069 RepID=UPI0024E0ED0E|nr:hypothetical protein [Shewanella glacialipiscicola]